MKVIYDVLHAVYKGKKIQVLLEHSDIHFIKFQCIEDHIMSEQWYEWGHQPNDWGIPHVKFQFVSIILH